MRLHEKLRDRHLILASSSPRRQQFLRDLKLSFEVRKKPVSETYPSHLNAVEIALYLAELKTRPYRGELKPEDILITGDTVIDLDQEILGKPESSTEAATMLKRLSGRSHRVISSVCLRSLHKTQIFYDTTTVFFCKLSDDDIFHYIKTYKPFDKAGAYGIQDWIGQIGITRIDGSYYTVMGMPIHKVYKALNKF